MKHRCKGCGYTGLMSHTERDNRSFRRNDVFAKRTIRHDYCPNCGLFHWWGPFPEYTPVFGYKNERSMIYKACELKYGKEMMKIRGK